MSMKPESRAPRPEGMSDESDWRHWPAESQLARIADGAMLGPDDEIGGCITRQQARTLVGECSRLRADGATLKVRADEALAAHAASFGALQTLSAALCDGEVDDYAALAEKIIARVRQLESDGATLREELVSGRAQWQQERDEYRQIVESSETALATLRERVKRLESSGATNVCIVCKRRKPVCCGFDESARDLHDPMHPDRDFPGPSWCADCCQKHKPATTPKEPESKRCSHCGCEWRGTPPTPDECPSCGATL